MLTIATYADGELALYMLDHVKHIVAMRRWLVRSIPPKQADKQEAPVGVSFLFHAFCSYHLSLFPLHLFSSQEEATSAAAQPANSAHSPHPARIHPIGQA